MDELHLQISAELDLDSWKPLMRTHGPEVERGRAHVDDISIQAFDFEVKWSVLSILQTLLTVTNR